MNTNQVVLIAGVTGNMGSRIATYLTQKEGIQLRGLVRSTTGRDVNQQKILEQLQGLGVELVEGDLNDLESLVRAATGVDTLLSAVNGNGSEEIELTGQLTLLEAAKRAGVSRFMPSDYSADYTQLHLGEHHNYDYRIQVAEAVKASGLNYTFIMSGAFMEVFFSPVFGVFDFTNGIVEQWGDGNTQFDLSTMDDVAKYTAEAAIDPRAIDTAFQFAGDVVTLNDVIAAYDEVKAQKLSVQHRGSVGDLKARIEEVKLSNPNPWMYIRLQYLWVMLSGKGKLTNLVNARYPNISPTSVKEFVHTLPSIGD